VNGQSLRAKKSQNTNFALLVHIELTQPVTDTTAYGQSIAYLATTIGGGRPLLQRLGDLRSGRRSTLERIERGHVTPTLRSVTPGDISMALPGRIVRGLTEGLERLDKVVPGVASDSTLLYAPEVKFYAMQITVNENMETNVPNLFVAGDGAGLSRGIVNAAATGLLAARGIITKAKA
ncbi:MAG: FAD-dependent oxidoreductase, partial [Hadesarchaea archaeon]|nr:FAD-dependent oxidoreductase [Hadesarchaea archaeon]